MIETIVEPKLLWTRREAAAALSISERTLWTLTDEGQIPCVRIRRSVRYDPVAVRSWIEAQKGNLTIRDNGEENS
jgi:excisionase family DNA binding protein